VNRQVQNMVLVLVGATVLRISAGDTYLRYVREGMRPLLLGAGAVLVLLGLVGAWRDERRRSPAGDHADDGGPRVGWALLLPVLALFLIAPPALGADAASRDAGTVAAPVDNTFPDLPPGDPVEVLISDYAVRAGWGGEETLAGRTVRIIGFVTPRDEGGWYLTRMALNCCAADALAVKVEVRGAAAPPADSWVEVVGTYVPSGADDPTERPPALDVSEVRQIEAPREPYV